MNKDIKLFEGQGVTTCQLQKDLKLDKMRLYRYANGIYKIESMKNKLICDLAYYFKKEPMELYNEMIRYQNKRKK